jgi:hypothetical protein
MGRLSRMSAERDEGRAEALSDLEEMLVAAAFAGALSYLELAPDGRKLKRGDRASALAQLEVCALCVVTAERERELLADLPATLPVTEMLTVVRVMQQGLILALSEDRTRRAMAVDGYTVMLYGRLAEAGWKAHVAAQATGQG